MNRFTDGQKYPLQPTLANTVNGIVAKWPDPERRSNWHATQCQDCGLVQVVRSLTLTSILFTPSHDDGKRRCPTCRLARMEAEYPNCTCHRCTDLRTEVRHRET